MGKYSFAAFVSYLLNQDLNSTLSMVKISLTFNNVLNA